MPPKTRSASAVQSKTARALFFAFPLALASWDTAAAQKPHCGTGLWMEKRLERGQALQRRAAARAFVALPVRTLETTSFAIRYALHGRNRVRTGAEDQALVDLTDSLYAALPTGLSEMAADSTVYARLDALGAGHPRYIQVMANIFEAARRYYVDTLGMRAPSETAARSIYYEAPATPGRKYPIDVADIGTADPVFRGQEIYALTYPTGFGGMLMENDFLFNSRVDTATGIPVGDSISSRYKGQLVHNYAAEWELGLKVTCFHELYHSVQFAYTPNEDRFHIWYETSATGMEERKAPEVDDYLQYLPAYMNDLAERGMHAFTDGGLSRYGNGIYHLFLTRELGEDFDVKLWNRLVTNGNDIKAGLEYVYSTYGTNPQDIYARYAAQLAFAGTNAVNPLPAFSPDLPLWPRLPSETVDLRDPGTKSFSDRHPPTSIRALVLEGSGNSGMALIQPDSLLRIVLARLGSDTSILATYSARIVPLDAPGTGGGVLAVLSNGNQNLTSAAVEVRLQASRVDNEVYPYPNPMVRATAGELMIFSRLERPAAVTVYTESGGALRVLAFNSDERLWSWDLTDAQGRRLKPGVYYYRVDDGALKPFYLK